MWAVLDGVGTVRVNVEPIADDAGGVGDATAGADTTGPVLAAVELDVAHPGAYPLIEHERHTAGVIELEVDPGVRCYATCFTPGLAA